MTALECHEPMDGDDTGNCDGPRVQFNHGDFEDGDSGVMILSRRQRCIATCFQPRMDSP